MEREALGRRPAPVYATITAHANFKVIHDDNARVIGYDNLYRYLDDRCKFDQYSFS